MKLRQYLDELNELVEENPAALEYEVVYAKDDEGNGFEETHYGPSMGLFEGSEFTPADVLDEEDRVEDANSVCIN